jgi:hypothetical protein
VQVGPGHPGVVLWHRRPVEAQWSQDAGGDLVLEAVPGDPLDQLPGDPEAERVVLLRESAVADEVSALFPEDAANQCRMPLAAGFSRFPGSS